MKRSEMVVKLINIVEKVTGKEFELTVEESSEILQKLEDLGMKPPTLSSIKCQALIDVYVYPCFNKWDEDFNKDEKAVKTYKRKKALALKREEARTKKLTFEHYYMCSECATAKGGIFPEGHVCTVMSGECPYCGRVDVTLIPWVDFNWPSSSSTDVAAKANRD